MSESLQPTKRRCNNSLDLEAQGKHYILYDLITMGFWRYTFPRFSRFLI